MTTTVSAPNGQPIQSIEKSFLLLKSATAKKLGKQAEGAIGYQVLSDKERSSLYVSITENSSGGYFSSEKVSFGSIESCIAKHGQDKPLLSKSFKDAFVGRSSNNPGFLVAILRAEGLLIATPEAETKHTVSGDWAEWKKSLLSEPGKAIETDPVALVEKQAERDSVADHKEHKKTLTLPRKKAA